VARGVTLGELVTKLRIAARYDPNPALSQNMVPLFIQTLQDTQERLWEEFDWPFLKVQRDKALAPGQRYIDLPADIDLERVVKVDVLVSGQWEPVQRGIELSDYNAFNSDTNQRCDPVLRWDVVDTGSGAQIEVWPLPASAATIRFRGVRRLAKLVDEADRADLDDQIIVGFAAVELLAGKGATDQAQIKLQQANNRLATLKGRVTHQRSGGFVLGGEGDCGEDRHRFPHGAVVVAVQPTS
jgi:hypothetical protein